YSSAGCRRKLNPSVPAPGSITRFASIRTSVVAEPIRTEHEPVEFDEELSHVNKKPITPRSRPDLSVCNRTPVGDFGFSEPNRTPGGGRNGRAGPSESQRVWRLRRHLQDCRRQVERGCLELEACEGPF